MSAIPSTASASTVWIIDISSSESIDKYIRALYDQFIDFAKYLQNRRVLILFFMLNSRTRRYLYANSRVLTPLYKAASVKALHRFLDDKKCASTGIHAYSGHIISQIDGEYYLKYVKIALYLSDGSLPDHRDIEARIDHINKFLTEIYDAPLNSGVQRIQLALAQLDEVLSQSHHLKPNA